MIDNENDLPIPPVLARAQHVLAGGKMIFPQSICPVLRKTRRAGLQAHARPAYQARPVGKPLKARHDRARLEQDLQPLRAHAKREICIPTVPGRKTFVEATERLEYGAADHDGAARAVVDLANVVVLRLGRVVALAAGPRRGVAPNDSARLLQGPVAEEELRADHAGAGPRSQKVHEGVNRAGCRLDVAVQEVQIFALGFARHQHPGERAVRPRPAANQPDALGLRECIGAVRPWLHIVHDYHLGGRKRRMVGNREKAAPSGVHRAAGPDDHGDDGLLRKWDDDRSRRRSHPPIIGADRGGSRGIPPQRVARFLASRLSPGAVSLMHL